MPKKYYGDKSSGFAGLPQKEMQKSYPKAPQGGDFGMYRDTQEQSDAFGRMAIDKLKKQKYN